jgi:hypothetical protein
MEISIRDILARHPVPGIREAQVRHSVAKAVTDLTGVEVAPRKIRHSEGRLVLSVPPVLKSALLLRLPEFTELLKREGVEIREVR